MEKSRFREDAIADEELNEVSGGASTGGCIRYTFVRGDTLQRVAARYGTTVELLMQMNGLESEDCVRAGRVIWVLPAE